MTGFQGRHCPNPRYHINTLPISSYHRSVLPQYHAIILTPCPYHPTTGQYCPNITERYDCVDAGSREPCSSNATALGQ